LRKLENVTKIILVRWVIGSFGVCLCIGLCEGANPKCANVGRLKLFFKMCGGKIFKTLRWIECRQTELGLCRVTAK